MQGLADLGFQGDRALCQGRSRFIIMHLTKFTPYPGSPIYRDLYGTNIRDDHWEKMNGMNFIWTPEGLTQEELDRNYRQLLVGFYNNPKISWYYAKFTFIYPSHFLRLLKFLALMVGSKINDGIRFFTGRDTQKVSVSLD